MRFFRILGGREDLLGKKELFLFEPLGEVRCFGGGTFFLLPFSSSFVVDVLFCFHFLRQSLPTEHWLSWNSTKQIRLVLSSQGSA